VCIYCCPDNYVRSQKNAVGDVRSQKNVKTPKKRQWKLWSDLCVAWLAPGLKPLSLPRARRGGWLVKTPARGVEALWY